MSELDNMTVYVFVRQDIELAMQLVQANHATFKMASQMKPGLGSPNLIIIGVPHLAALKRVLHKLDQAAVPSETFEDPDFNFGPTAVATYPLDAEAKQPLSNYRLWRHVPAAAPLKSVAGLNADAGANADVAQTRRENANGEHSGSNREVTGGSPVVSSNVSRCCQ